MLISSMSGEAAPTTKPEITGEIMINDLAKHYPNLVDILIIEYGFHCVGCFASQFENLKDGARVHGIEGKDFEDMLKHLQLQVA